MQAALMVERAQPLEIREHDVPQIGRRDALIRVEACGICRTDWHLWQGDWTWIGMELPLPAVLGHEFAGVVESVGTDVQEIHPGMRVLPPFLTVSEVAAALAQEARS